MAIPSPVILRATIRPARPCTPVLERNTCRPAAAVSLLALGDFCAVSAALTVSVVVRHAFGGNYAFSLYSHLWPMLALFPVAYAMFGLYPGIILGSMVPEIRRTAAASTVVFLILAELTFLLRVADLYSRLVFLMAWSIALVAVPLTRAAVRGLCAKRNWWGYPVVILGDGSVVMDLLRKLQRRPQCGLRPMAIVAQGHPEGSTIHGVPVFECLDQAGLGQGQLGSSGLVALSGLGRRELAEVLRLHGTVLPRVLMAPGLEGISTIDVEAKDVCQSLLLESRNRLLMPWPRRIKRTLDVVFALTAAVLAIPLAAAIAAAIRLDSAGPVFYGHTRIGRNGRRITVWKFRTMVVNAAEVLEQYLWEHPALAAEWQRTQKLKNDPRVTRFGRLLRQLSLDELPQLWNVLRGDMSLVGPRPIVTDEIEKYRDEYAFYARVRPGLTGLWQVSGRNDVSFAERVGLDTYYVRNWSPWLDVYVLARTVSAVLTRAGAY